MKQNHFDSSAKKALTRRQFLTRSGLGLAGLGLGSACGRVGAAAAEDITISSVALGRTPIVLTGYSGEALDVLRFDLEIQGFRVVADLAAADYELIGGNADLVEGRLVNLRTKRDQLEPARYTGASVRAQAHTLSDDVVRSVTERKPIARTRIAFKVGTGEATEIYVADYDGARAQAVTQDNKQVEGPAWVPNQRVLLYTSYVLHYPDIYTQDLNTGSRKVFAKFPGSNLSPAISPDGKRVAMILSKDGAPNLYVSDIDGENLKRLTTDPASKSSPCWSPDGKTICFQSGLPVGAWAEGLYLIPANGGPRIRLRTPGIVNRVCEPDWSPDNKWIAFTVSRGAAVEIYKIPAAGGEPIRLADGEDPSWAPNSRTIIYSKHEGNDSVLSLLDADTKFSITLPIKVKNSSEPAWAR